MNCDKDMQLIQAGYLTLAGVDEVGRGPLAGPVVAACVVTDGCVFVDGVNDSKKVSPKKREILFDRIMDTAVAVGIGEVSPAQIDEMNIRQATLLAMRQAVENTGFAPGMLLIDGVDTLHLPCPQRSVVKGDSTYYAIAAASIIAKVTRDRQMCRYDELYPGYGFAAHKGYGTAEHIRALRELGPTPIHRMSFLTRILSPGGEKNEK